MSKKKPTKKDIETVISNIIMEISTLRAGINGLDVAISEYIKYKKDTEGFQKYIDKKVAQKNDENKNNE